MLITVRVLPGEGIDDDVAERMLYIALGIGCRREIEHKGRKVIFWICSFEFVEKFEATCHLCKIPVEISFLTQGYEIEPLRSPKPTRPPMRLVS